MTREGALRLLFIQWTAIGGLAVALVTVQAISGKYGEDSELAWNWLLGQFTPALSVLSAAVFSDASRRWRSATASPWKWKVALVLGGVQMLCLFTVLLIEPLLSISSFDLFSRTQWMLALLQGIVVAAIGAVVFDGR